MKTFLRLALLLSVSVMPMPAYSQAATQSATEAVAPQVVINVTSAANLRTLADQAGYDGHSPANYGFVVPKGQNVLGAPGGGSGIDTGEWPDNVVLVLVVAGNVYGGGGNGGDGGDIPGAQEGGKGGDAIYVRAPIGIAITATGSVKGGGGGGGGGTGEGSGGGGGFPNGKRGELGNATFGGAGGEAGKYGTPSGGGKGGQKGTAGGDGGDAAMPGGSSARAGGGAGYAIRANDFPVSLENKGDLRGEAG